MTECASRRGVLLGAGLAGACGALAGCSTAAVPYNANLAGQAPGAAATLVPMDLRDFAAIDRLGEALYRRWGRLDAFVGNAGVLGLLTPLHQLDAKTWDEVMAVNVTANWRLIRSLDPLLRLSSEGRVAFVTSGAASRADLRAYWGPYAASKAALDALARTYAAETQSTNVRVNLIGPGPTRTRMRAAAMPGEDPMSLKTADKVAEK